MANVNQIYSLLNETASQMVGGVGITVKDTSSFLSFGDQVMSTDANREEFYKKLPDVIGKTVIKARELKKKSSSMLMDSMTFGMALQRIQVNKIARASKNNSWSDWKEVEGAQVNTQNKNPFDYDDNTALQSRLFAKRGVFEIEPKVIRDYQLYTAFKSEANFASFVNLIFLDMYNGMELGKRELENLALCTSIAETLHSGNAKSKRNVLAEYNALKNTNLTVTQCKYDKEFLRYFTQEMHLAIKKLSDVSTLYNSEGAERWTDSQDLVVKMLSNFTTASDIYLSSDTFHKELVALPNYEEVNFFQGQGENASFEDCSKVSIKLNGENDVTQSGVIATIYDKDRVGVLFDRIRTKSIYNPASEETLYFHKADKGYFLDNSYNSIVFYVA